MYAYKGIGPSGKPTGGVRDADSPKGLRQLLRKDGVVVTSCELSKTGAGATARGAAGKGLSKDVDLGGIVGGVRKTEIAAFTRQLATLLSSGIPLAEALGALFDQTEHVRFKVAVGEVRTAVNEGSSLGDALGKHPKLFDNLFVSMVRAGEIAGNLEEVLTRLSDFMESGQKLKGKVQAAMIYPILMLVLTTAIMAVLMIAVVPEVTSMFKSQGKTLPINTRMLIWFSDFVKGNILWILIGGGLAGWGFHWWTKSPAGRPQWHGFILKAPVVGPLTRQLSISRFARTLGTMLAAGVPMLRALDTAKEILGNVVLQKAIEEAKKAVTEGESLAVTLKRSGHFPASMVHMVAVGERAGQLETMLQRVADAYDAEVDMKLTQMTALLEPLMLVVMGGGVAFVVFSILQPIMEMGQFGAG